MSAATTATTNLPPWDPNDPTVYLDWVKVPEAEKVFVALTELAWKAGVKVEILDTLPNDAEYVGKAPKDTPRAISGWDKGVHGIWIRAGQTASANVYLLLHELGHTFGPISRAASEGPASKEEHRAGELEAESVAAGVLLQGFGIEPNYSYLFNWSWQPGLSNEEMQAQAGKAVPPVMPIIRGIVQFLEKKGLLPTISVDLPKAA